MTVSFVLNDKRGQVSDETRERVLRAVRDMGYRPRAAGRSGRTRGHIPTVGIVTGVEGRKLTLSGYYNSIITNLMIAADERQQNVTFFTSSLFHTDTHQSIRTYCDGRCDGLFVIAPFPGSDVVKAIRERGIPYVLIGDTGDDEHCSFVDVDNCNEGFRVTKYLIRLGHRRIAFFGGPNFVRSANQRHQGFLNALKESEIPVNEDLVLTNVGSETLLYDETRRMMERLPSAERPTAIVCWNDLAAMRPLLALGDMGLDVPRDVSVMGFDDDVVAAVTNPPLTTARQPYRQIAECALDALEAHINGDRAPRRVLLPTELIVRSTVSAPLGAEGGGWQLLY